jgi:uncharacterized protein YjiS (DUF1127 family)
MLYRPTPRPSALARIAGVFSVFGALFASLRRNAGDKHFLDQLNARELADLGLTRVEDDRWRHLY